MVVNLVVKIRLGNLTIFLLETIRSSGQVQSILRLESRLDFVNQVEFHFLIIIHYFLLWVLSIIQKLIFFLGFADEWICPDLSVDEERNIAEALSLSLGKRSISAACSEETLVERGIIPSISFSEKEASVMASNNSPNATFKGEKRKRLVIPDVAQKKQQKQGGSSSQSVSQAQQITPLIPPLLPPLPSDKGTCIIAPQNPSVHQLSYILL